MKFLPDSAVLGTLGHIKHASKKKTGSAVGLGLVRDRHEHYYPQRTVAELLELAGHAKKGKRAGK
jgi:phage gp29-like protein